MSSSVKPIQISKVTTSSVDEADDLLVVEEPLEIQLGYGPENDRKQKSISVTMRTPGHDFELTTGFLFTEGIINIYADVNTIKYCVSKTPEENGNKVKVELKPNVDVDIERLSRNFYTTSSCGVCGKASIEAIETLDCPIMLPNQPVFKGETIHDLPNILRTHQTVFEHTGGIHAAALFHSSGEMIAMREDVGRHNAVDKLIGSQLFDNKTPLSDCLIMVSGRASFELIQKSVMAGIPILAAVGAPSSLAVDLANKFNMTILGFVRDNRFNIYSGKARINVS
ncbi:MAG: formate dehydrogenase accessory sulfurtransferase FdhD [Flavobacteriales bacterium]|nr:formate dehydrogenase accessory sulfurtransferase FdhD [Flavobacteriales bacterium]